MYRIMGQTCQNKVDTPLGVVLGSNIGTAVGGQIISLDIKHYVPALMGLGVLGFLLGRTKTQKNLGFVVLGFGLMF
jgi:phosphate:Na+ symporter